MRMASRCAFHQDLQEMKRWNDNEGRKYLESVPFFHSIWAYGKNQAHWNWMNMQSDKGYLKGAYLLK